MIVVINGCTLSSNIFNSIIPATLLKLWTCSLVWLHDFHQFRALHLK